MGRVCDRRLQNPGDDTYLDAELHFTKTHNIQNQGAFNELAEVWFKIEKKVFLSIENSELLELVTMGGCRGKEYHRVQKGFIQIQWTMAP